MVSSLIDGSWWKNGLLPKSALIFSVVIFSGQRFTNRETVASSFSPSI